MWPICSAIINIIHLTSSEITRKIKSNRLTSIEQSIVSFLISGFLGTVSWIYLYHVIRSYFREFKKAEEALKKAKKEAEQHSSSWKQREQEFETLRLEVTELEQAVATSKQTLQETVEAAVGLQESLQDAKEEHARATVSA